MEDLGKIIKVKNLCFKMNNQEKKYTVDHSFDTGRPAIIIAEDDDYMYFLTVTSSIEGEHSHLFPLKSSRFPKKSAVNVRDIYRKNICGVEDYGSITNRWEMKEILEYFYHFQTHNFKDEYFDAISPLVEKVISDIPTIDEIRKR